MPCTNIITEGSDLIITEDSVELVTEDSVCPEGGIFEHFIHLGTGTSVKIGGVDSDIGGGGF
jgi:hypothetical protein